MSVHHRKTAESEETINETAEKSSQPAESTENGSVSAAGEAESPKRIPRPPLFEYPALPKCEMLVYFAAVIFTLAWGWYSMYDLSQDVRNKKLKLRSFGTLRVWNHPLFGRRVKDCSNYEWHEFMYLCIRLMPGLVVHAIMFNLADFIFTSEQKMHKQIFRTVCEVPIIVYVFGAAPFVTAFVQCALLFAITRIFRHKLVTWLSGAPVMYMLMHGDLVFAINNKYHGDIFTLMLYVSYKTLSSISYNIDWLDGKTRKEDHTLARSFLRMLHYTHYLPYGVSLIVLYRDWECHMAERQSRKRDFRDIVWLAVRLIFWACLADSVLYFVYFEAIMYAPKTLYQIRQDQLTALGLAVGQFFHMKYVIVFGVPRLFAKIDNLQPQPGPVCITHITMYSKIWRGFDRGLYNFFKTYIFIPICQPTFAVWRKMIGVFMAYGFVLLWHGTSHANLVWICLNITELFIEIFGKTLYSWQPLREYRENNLSDQNFRRVLAWLQVIPFAFALYSNFYFLAGEDAGWTFVDRIFWGETVPLRYPFFLLISLGYCYSHCCMEVDRHYAIREKQRLADMEKKEDKEVGNAAQDKNGDVVEGAAEENVKKTQ